MMPRSPTPPIRRASESRCSSSDRTRRRAKRSPAGNKWGRGPPTPFFGGNMALFVVRHQHAPERCPAHDPYAGARLLNYLSRPNVRQHGVHIQGEAIVQGEHTLYLIVEAGNQADLREFMQPFLQAGSIDIYPASTCARVVASGGCGAPLPVSDLGPSLDPEEACQQAID